MSSSSHDILNIDLIIMSKFKEEENKLDVYKTNLENLKQIYTEHYPHRLKKNIQTHISELEDKIFAIENKIQMNFYIYESFEILNKYKKILQTPLKINFIKNTQEVSPEKEKLVNAYLEISKKYLKSNLIHSVDEIGVHNIKCLVCYNGALHVINNSIFICPECGNQQDILINKSSYKDLDRINISAKYTIEKYISEIALISTKENKIAK